MARLRGDVARLEVDRYLHPDIAAATALVRNGAIVAAVGDMPLPALDGAAR
jgi:histidine ammonia-lyase